jgi:single-strand DNA-binding protein
VRLTGALAEAAGQAEPNDRWQRPGRVDAMRRALAQPAVDDRIWFLNLLFVAELQERLSGPYVDAETAFAEVAEGLADQLETAGAAAAVIAEWQEAAGESFAEIVRQAAWRGGVASVTRVLSEQARARAKSSSAVSREVTREVDMAGSLNRAELIGHVGRDPELRSWEGEKQMATISVATSDRWKDRLTGEQRERTDWHRVAVFNEHLVDIVQKYVRKGSLIFIEGELHTRKWTDASNMERYSTEIVLSHFNARLVLLDRRPADKAGEADDHDSEPLRDNDIPY